MVSVYLIFFLGELNILIFMFFLIIKKGDLVLCCQEGLNKRARISSLGSKGSKRVSAFLIDYGTSCKLIVNE